MTIVSKAIYRCKAISIEIQTQSEKNAKQTTLRISLHQSEWQRPIKLMTNHAGEDVKYESHIHYWWFLRKPVWQLLRTMGIYLLQDPAIALLGINPPTTEAPARHCSLLLFS